jgi:hypothetical protein
VALPLRHDGIAWVGVHHVMTERNRLTERADEYDVTELLDVH